MKPTPERTRASVDRPFPVSASACSMRFKTPTKSRPGSRANDTPGLADQKDTDRLMDIQARTSDARPSLCPTCGLPADNGVRRLDGTIAHATYLDVAGHAWSVSWLEVA